MQIKQGLPERTLIAQKMKSRIDKENYTNVAKKKKTSQLRQSQKKLNIK